MGEELLKQGRFHKIVKSFLVRSCLTKICSKLVKIGSVVTAPEADITRHTYLDFVILTFGVSGVTSGNSQERIGNSK